MRFSSRVDTSEPNPIILATHQAQHKGACLRKLNDSNPTSHGLGPTILSSAYTADPRGPKEVRQQLAAMINRRDNRQADQALNPDNLYVLSSTSQAYAWLMMLLCDPGDTVLGPTPGYPLIESIARLQCVRYMPYSLHYDGSWTIDLAQLRMLISNPANRIQALVLINPNNPTGSYVKQQERASILELCSQYHVAIIADEVFYEYALEPFDANARLAGENSTLVFALDGFSKMLAAPHAKVGWIEVSGPQNIVSAAQRRLDVIADDFLPMGATVSMHVPQLLAVAEEQYQRVHQRIVGNLHKLRVMLESDPACCVSMLRAEGGWNILLRLPSCIDDDELALYLIDKYQVIAQPGYYFDVPSNGYMAFSLLPEPRVFEANVRVVLDAVTAMLA